VFKNKIYICLVYLSNLALVVDEVPVYVKFVGEPGTLGVQLYLTDDWKDTLGAEHDDRRGSVAPEYTVQWLKENTTQ